MSRDAGIVAARMDMDQSQFPADVSPAAGGTGIYDKLIPILQQWNQQYDFVGSYYINIGDNSERPPIRQPPTGPRACPITRPSRRWAARSATTPTHTSSIHRPRRSRRTPSATTPAGSTQVTLDAVPSFYGITVGMVVTGLNIGSNTTLPGAAGEGGAVANTTVTAVSGNTITLSYVPGGYGPEQWSPRRHSGRHDADLLSSGGKHQLPADGDDRHGQECNRQSLHLRLRVQSVEDCSSRQSLAPRSTVPPFQVPHETFATDQNILPYYQSVAATATTPGYTGYLTGGWTGIGSGYPSAIGYMSPSATDRAPSISRQT